MKIILFDMDGTLLTPNNKIHNRTKLFIRERYEAGDILGISTGRPNEVIRDSFDDDLYNMFSYFSGYNGGQTNYKNNEWKYTVNLSVLKNIKGNFAISISDGYSLYIDKPKLAHNISNRYKAEIKPLQSFNKKEANMIRLIFNSATECSSYYKELLNSKIQKHYSITKSTGIFILISNKKASKGKAIKSVFGNKEVIFFGDSNNDLSAFEMDNIIGICPSNANTEIKSKSSLILCNGNDEGIYLDIKKIPTI